ncbi:MAG: PAS domain S-box protein [Sterolibacteriaceae bacterium MAG5]|nr:PAS domain S-box protein [Candidatus Nitricoxidireducens bremensis]
MAPNAAKPSRSGPATLLLAALAAVALLASAVAMPANLPYEMFEKHGAVMLLIDPASGEIIDANDAAASFYGYPKEKLRSLRISDLNALKPAEVAAERQRALTENRNYFVFPHRLASGEIRTVEVYSWPIEVSGRRLLYSIIHDASSRKLAEQELVQYKERLEDLVEARTRELTEQSAFFNRLLVAGLVLQLIVIVYLAETVRRRRKAEAGLRDSEDLFRSYFEHALIAMAITSPEKGWVVANEALCKLLGYSLEELRATTWNQLTHPDDLAADLAHFERMLAGEIDGYSLEKRFIRKDGGVVDTILSVRLIHRGEGANWEVLAQLQDITARRAAEREVLRVNADLENRVHVRTAELEQANRELESFSYSASHDLRTPLRALNGYAHILRNEEADRLSADGRQMLERIWLNAEKMGVLIDELLQFARLSRHAMKTDRVDMRALATEVCAELRGEYPKAAIHIAPLPPAVGDGTLLRQVWQNLAANALKFSSKREQPEIRIDAEAVAGEIIYRIADNGAGFDMAHAGRLFDVFQRMHDEREFPGTGAGLAIVKRIVARHGGRVWAEAEPDRGATFYFTLPLRD